MSVIEPGAHERQLGAPLAGIYVPNEHSWHGCVELALEYPASHCVQIVAPVESKVFVIDPGLQAWHGSTEVLPY